MKFLEVRSRLLMSIRTFFHEHSFMEVNTPVRIPAPALEDYIDAIESDAQYLRTSPELHMKRMIAAGYEKIYQIGSCFRKGEYGDRHRTEFTMLEWYEVNTDYKEILDFTELMVKKASNDLSIRQDYFQQTWDQLTVSEAFQKYAGKDVNTVIDSGNFE